MGFLIKAYRLLNILSIDIVLGAVICSMFFARLLDVVPRPYALVALGLTVWIIYTADHLLDARQVRGAASSERHRFHQRHFTTLSVLVAVGVVTNIFLIFFIKRPVLYAGGLIFMVVGVYLLFNRRLRFLKEVVVAILYCIGLLLPSIPVTDVKFTPVHYVFFSAFFLIALSNLILFSLFDKRDDETDNRRSFVTVAGERTATLVLWGIFALIGFLSFSLGGLGKTQLSMLVAAMAIPLVVVLYFKGWSANYSRYRLLGDAVFLLPGLFLIPGTPWFTDIP